MTTDRRELHEWEKAECAALKEAIAAYNAKQPREKRFTQEKLAAELGMTQGNLNGHLNGKRPLNKDIAARITFLTGIPIASYSPRLAKEIATMAAVQHFEEPEKADHEPLRVPSADNPKEAAAAAVMEMLQKHGKGLSAAAQQKIADAVADSLAEPAPVAGQQSNVITANFSRAARIADGDILIPQYDVRAAMGNGQVPADYVEFVRNIIVSGPQLEKMGLDYTSPANLSVITGWGQSMEGTINDKDPVVVDRGVNEFVGDGVYVITWLGLLYIKRLQVHDAEHFKLISDNKQLDKQVARVDDVTIHAKVLLVWNAKKL